MAIGTPIAILTAVDAIASGSPVTTNVDAPIGSLIIVAVTAWTSLDVAITGVSDSAGNTYTQAVQDAATTGMAGSSLWSCPNTTHDLPSGGTITATVAGAGNYALAAFKVSNGNSGVDQTNTLVQTSATTSASLTTGALVQTDELIIAVSRANSAAFGTWTPGTGFTNLLNLGASSVVIDYAIVSSSASKTYAPSWTASATFDMAIASFRSSAVSSALAGSVGTGAEGSLVAGISRTPAQIAASGSRGSVTAGISRTAAQALATGSEGSLKAALAVAPAQLVATASKGSPTPSITRAATQVSGAGVRGSLIAGIGVTLTHQVATGSEGSLKAKLMVSVSGEVAAVTPGQAFVPPTPGVMSAKVWTQRIAIRATLG